MTDSRISRVSIATEFWDENEEDEIIEIFSSFPTEKRKVERWEAGVALDPALWIVFSFVGGSIVTGFLNAVGSNIWTSLKEKISKKASDKKYPGVRFSIENSEQKVSLDLRTNDPKLIEKGMNTIQTALELVNEKENRSELYFDLNAEEWKIEPKRKIVKTINGICASANSPVEKEGKKIIFRKEDLQNIADRQVGIPVSINHEGRPVGVVTKAWVDGDLVRFEAGIFEGLSKEQEETLSEVNGVSMEFHHSGFEEKRGENNQDE